MHNQILKVNNYTWKLADEQKTIKIIYLYSLKQHLLKKHGLQLSYKGKRGLETLIVKSISNNQQQDKLCEIQSKYLVSLELRIKNFGGEQSNAFDQSLTATSADQKDDGSRGFQT